MRLLPSRSRRRWTTRLVLLGAVVGGVALARRRTIDRHEIDLRAGLQEPAPTDRDHA